MNERNPFRQRWFARFALCSGQTRFARCLCCLGYILTTLLCAWFLAQTTFFLLAEPRLPLPGTTPAGSVTPNRAGQPSGNMSAILTRNLFAAQSSPANARPVAPQDGKSTTAETAPLGDLEALPLSTRGWKLLGTIAAPDPHASRAIIATSGGQQSYREGDSIDDSTVAHIQRKTVILQKGGQRERLELNTGADERGQQDAAPAHTTQAGQAGQARQMLADPAALLRDISLKPRSVGGVQGMEITTLRAESPLHELGLRAGDLVLSVNDIPIRTFDDLSKLLAVVTTQTLRVTLLRNGSEVRLE